MLILYNTNRQKINVIANEMNSTVSSKINEFSKLTFSLPTSDEVGSTINSQFLVSDNEDLYRIKKVSSRGENRQYECQQDVTDITNKLFPDGFQAITATVITTIQQAIATTGWTVVDMGAPIFKRTTKLDGCDAMAVLDRCKSKFRCELKFNSLDKKIYVSEKFGSNKGVYFTDQLNLKDLNTTQDTLNFATRLYARGKDGMTFASVNNGKDYVDNFTYSTEVVNALWIDNRYTNPHELKEDAIAKLADMCKPSKTYSGGIYDLSKILPDYDFLQYDIGDTVTIINSVDGLRDVQRVVETKKSRNNPEDNSVVWAKPYLTFEELEQQKQEELDTVTGAFNEDGTINGNKLDSVASSAIQDRSITADKIAANTITAYEIAAHAITSNEIAANTIDAGNIKAGAITANSAIIDDLAITTGKIANAAITVAKIQEAFIDSLVVAQGQFESAHIKDAAIGTAQIANAAIKTANIDDAQITTAKIADASITDLKVANIDAGKIKTGDLAADRIKTNVITAINASIGKINAEHIDVSSITVDEIDASKITTGTLDANRIKGSAITAINLSTELAVISSAKIGDIEAGKIKTGSLSADVIKTNVITAINASIGKIDAAHIDVDSITVNNIDAGKITTGDLDAERIKANVISAINTYAGTAVINVAKIGKITVTDANILDGTISGLKVANGSITNAQIKDATIEHAKIKSINAGSITTGTLDASRITVTNLRAESIIAGSLTIDGDNLIRNSAWLKNTSYWTCASFATRDTAKLYDTSYTIKVEKTSYTTPTWGGIYSEVVKTSPGQAFVASIYFMTDDYTTFDDALGLEIYAYRADGTVIANICSKSIKPSVNNTWTRLVISGVCPSDTTQIKLYAWVKQNGRCWFGRPMLQRGTVASEWKCHTDELISNGAINNDKLGDGSVTANKLVLDEIFANSGFIDKFQTTELVATQITTGTISSERLDLKGLVAFESLAGDLQNSFSPEFLANGQLVRTYINGANILTGSVTADKIIANGLDVKGPDGLPTFSIADNGEVYVSANMQSSNFTSDNNKYTGWQINRDGNAVFNNAVLRGNVELSDSGMTNFGVQMTNPNLSNQTREVTIAPNASNSTYITASGNFTPNTEYSISIDASEVVQGTFTEYTVLLYNVTDGTIALPAQKFKIGKDYQSWTFTTPSAAKRYDVLIYAGVQGQTANNSIKLTNIMVNIGKPTQWCPSTADGNVTFTRIWAGSDYAGRDTAPFRVLNDGSVIATKGIFDGTFTGSIDIGNIHIRDTNTDSALFVIRDNTDTIDKVRLTDDSAKFNVNVSLGPDTKNNVEYSNDLNTLSTLGTKISMTPTPTGELTFEYIPDGPTSGINILGNSGGRHTMSYKNKSLVIDSVGSTGTDGDIIISKQGGTKSAKVNVQGEVVITDKITSPKHKIEMRNIDGKGIYFYAV